MTITLNSDIDRRIREKLVSGQYQSVEEVLTAALRALDVEDESVAAIAEGIADIESGNYRSLEEANAEFYQKHGISPHK